MMTRRKAAPLVRKHKRRPATTIAEPIAMTIEQIKQTDLTIGERDRLDRDVELIKRLGAGAHLDEWLARYDGAPAGRKAAQGARARHRGTTEGFAGRPAQAQGRRARARSRRGAGEAGAQGRWLAVRSESGRD